METLVSFTLVGLFIKYLLDVLLRMSKSLQPKYASIVMAIILTIILWSVL